MTMKTAQLRLALLVGLSLLPACSSDDKSDGDTGSGGSSGGTTSNSGGAGKATGGKAGSSTAGSSTGGSNTSGGNNGGSAGFSFGGAGGINPDDYMCDPVPEVGSNCADGTQPCLNGTDVCSCQMGEWACDDFGLGEGGGGPGIGEIECPASQPMSGTACGDTIGFCPYGGQNMGCVCVGGNWNCN